MKNQTFNIKRFLTYASFNLKMNSRTYWMTPLSIALVIFGMLVFSMYKAHFFALEGWVTVFVISGIISIGLMVASAFPYLRKKETQIQFYMQPASLFEKYIFEFLLRFVGFWIIFPLLFWGAGELAYFVSSGLRTLRDMDMEGIRRVSFLYDWMCTSENFIATYKFVVMTVLGGMAFIFAGTCQFMKHALLKTVLFVFGLGAAIVYYFYFIVEQLGFKSTLNKAPEAGTGFILVAIAFVLMILVYGYYKLKEKEV